MVESVIQLKSKLREYLKRQIDWISENHSGPMPTQSVVTIDDGQRNISEIKKPSKVLARYESSDLEEVTAAAEEVIDSGLVDLPETTYEFPSSNINGYPTRIDNPSRDDLVAHFIPSIRGVLSDILDHEGSFDFSEDAFETAYNHFLESALEQPVPLKTVAPLVNFDMDVDRLGLHPEDSYDYLQVSDLHKVRVQSITIEKLTDEELSTLYTLAHNRDFVSRSYQRSSLEYAIKTQVKGYSYLTHHSVATEVSTALRLLFADKPEMQYAGDLVLSESGQYDRTGIYQILARSPVEFQLTYPRPRSRFKLSKQDAMQFSEFWKQYSEYINVTGNSRFSDPIRRFNQIYAKSETEDKIVDSIIGIESTLLKDLGNNSSITFRLMTRGGMLLESEMDISRERIWRFLKSLYFARGEIVHGDKNITDILKDDRFTYDTKDSTRFVVRSARSFLANIIIMYIRQRHINGNSITETNLLMDQATKNADSPF